MNEKQWQRAERIAAASDRFWTRVDDILTRFEHIIFKPWLVFMGLCVLIVILAGLYTLFGGRVPTP